MPRPTDQREMRRRGFLALAGTTVAAALGACAGRPTGTQHLRLSSWNIPTDLDSYQRLAEEFVAAHPGTTLTNNPALSSPWGPVMAVATLTVLPLLVVFIVFQRQFVQGIASSGIK